MVSVQARWVVVVMMAFACYRLAAAEPQLLAHWPLAVDARDTTANKLHLTAKGVDFNAPGPSAGHAAARFDGRADCLELTDVRGLQLGRDDFTIHLTNREPRLEAFFAEERRKGRNYTVDFRNPASRSLTVNLDDDLQD